MNYAATTFQDIIARSFSGRKSSLTERSGLSSPSITRLSKGTQAFTASTLTAVCNIIPPDDARALCLAACRDLIPPEIAHGLSIHHHSSSVEESPSHYGPQVDQESERILSAIRHLAASEPETRDWLHHLGKWIAPIEAAEQSPNSSPETDLPPEAKTVIHRTLQNQEDTASKETPPPEIP